MSFPEEDVDFHEVKIVEVDLKSGWIKGDDGFSFGIPENSSTSIVPEVGMTARFYGKGIGYRMRGLFLNGEKVYYKTEEEQERADLEETYGVDASDWLARWDSGRSVWSVEMGGLGPGYEQVIQIIAAEILRVFLDKKYDFRLWSDKKAWELHQKEMESIVFPVIDKLGWTGAQYGGALNVAVMIYKFGPIPAFSEPNIKKRTIIVNKGFPHL